MQFLIKHLIFYIAGFLLLAILAVVCKLLWNWYVFSFVLFIDLVWLIGYFPYVIRQTYRKIVDYITTFGEAILKSENREQHIKDMVVKIANDQFGLPEFITKRIVKMINVKKILKIIDKRITSVIDKINR